MGVIEEMPEAKSWCLNPEMIEAMEQGFYCGDNKCVRRWKCKFWAGRSEQEEVFPDVPRARMEGEKPRSG